MTVHERLDAFQESGWIGWVVGNILEGLYNIPYALWHIPSWLAWTGGTETLEDKQSLMRFVYFGGSTEFFFVLLVSFIIMTLVAMRYRSFMWGVVRVLEGFANSVGRLFAWAGLLMVLQQIVIVFMQRIFLSAEISLGFGRAFTFDVSWWGEELKFYNALVVCLCATYTFVQGGHVRVDLVYSAVSFRTKKIIDMIGSIIFMMPAAVLVWMYSWYFLWRHLIVPKPSASDTLDRLVLKARAMRWNVETIGFSPNGFNAYFMFKILLVAFTAMVFLQAIAFFYRSYLELREGPEAEGKFLDRDNLGDPDADLVAEIH